MLKKKHQKDFIMLILLGMAVVFCIHNSYLGANQWPMHTEETIDLRNEVKATGLGKMYVYYRAIRVLEVKCLANDWKEKDIEKTLDMIQSLLQNDDFQKSYAQKYARRYDVEVTAAHPKEVVVYFSKKGELLPIAMYTSSEPFLDWYQP